MNLKTLVRFIDQIYSHESSIHFWFKSLKNPGVSIIRRTIPRGSVQSAMNKTHPAPTLSSGAKKVLFDNNSIQNSLFVLRQTSNIFTFAWFGGKKVVFLEVSEANHSLFRKGPTQVTSRKFFIGVCGPHRKFCKYLKFVNLTAPQMKFISELITPKNTWNQERMNFSSCAFTKLILFVGRISR